MLAGLRAMDDPDGVAFVCATDMPLLDPCFVRAGDRRWSARTTRRPCRTSRAGSTRWPPPTAAGWRRGSRTGSTTAARSLTGLIDACAARRLDAALLLADPALAAADPRLDSLLNVNTPEDLSAARDAQSRRANRTGAPAAPSSSSPSQASAVAPASDVTA